MPLIEAQHRSPAAPTHSLLYRSPDPRLGVLEIDPVLYGWSASRDQAMSIPTVAACRNLICGTVAQLDVQRTRGAEVLAPGALLSRPDPDATWPATIAATVDDLLFYGRAYWLVLAFDGQATAAMPNGYPVRARRLPATDVSPTLNPDWTAYTRLDAYVVGGVSVDPRFVIAFDAGHEGVLRYGLAALGAAYALEAAARRLSDVQLPAGVLENQGHEISEADARALVAGFQEARRENGVAFLQGIKYTREQLNAADLQLIEARANAATEVCRLFNVPVQLAAASPSGNASAQLYANLTTTLASLLTGAVGPYLRAVESSLSSEQVSPRGQDVHFRAGQWLRADPAAAADYATGLYSAGIISRDEARTFLQIAPDASGAPLDLTPGKV